MGEEAPAIGIDLGTTNSCAAVVVNDKVTLIHGDDGSNIMASFVFFKKSGEFIVGNAAKESAYEKPQNGIFGVKRFIGFTYEEFKNEKALSMFPYIVENKENKPNIIVKTRDKTMNFAPEEISAKVLAKLKERAEEKLRQSVTKAVITVPAHFDGTQRQATIDAGRIAGLEVLRIINEPTAAILAFDVIKNKNNNKCNVLVYDFGGGTFDVSIATITDTEIDIKASNGEAFLGGDDLTNNLIEYFVSRFKQQHNIDLKKNYKALDRLRQKAEMTKKTLSHVYEHDIEIDCIDDNDEFDFECSVTRSLFENLNMDLFKKTLKCIEKTLEDAKMKKEEIDEILLVGGSTRIPYVRKLVEGYFGKKPNASVHPDEVVAIGAARQAAISDGIAPSKESKKVSDVCSLSLGIELHSGEMHVIIPRHTKIPSKNTARYFNALDYQKNVDLSIYEGEAPMASDNKFLSKFVLENIRSALAKQVKLEVTFEISESGILTATAIENDANNSSKIDVSIYKNNLSEQEIEEMVAKAEKLKIKDNHKKTVAQLKDELFKKHF